MFAKFSKNISGHWLSGWKPSFYSSKGQYIGGGGDSIGGGGGGGSPSGGGIGYGNGGGSRIYGSARNTSWEVRSASAVIFDHQYQN